MAGSRSGSWRGIAATWLLLLLDGAAPQACPATSASAATPIKEILSTICRRDDCAAVRPPAECVDCSMVTSLLEILIAEEEEGSAESAELVGAQQTLGFLCDPCVQPIFPQIIGMDEPGAAPFPEERTFASACGSPACLDRYHELAQAHAAASKGRTTALFNDLKHTCSNRRPDKPLATRQVRELLLAIDSGGVVRAAGRLRAEAGAERSAGRLQIERGRAARPAGVEHTGALAGGTPHARVAVAALLVLAVASASVAAALVRRPRLAALLPTEGEGDEI